MIWRFNADDNIAMRRVKREYLRRLQDRWTDADLWSAEVIFGELVGNAIRHAGGDVCVSLHDFTGKPVVSVRDRVRTMPHAVQDEGDPQFLEHGRGFQLIRRLANRIFVMPDNNGKEIAAELPTAQHAES